MECHAVRQAQASGVQVEKDMMAVCDEDGFMQRTMRLAGKPGSAIVTDNILAGKRTRNRILPSRQQHRGLRRAYLCPAHGPPCDSK